VVGHVDLMIPSTAVIAADVANAAIAPLLPALGNVPATLMNDGR
jgi:hypothetical protein